MLIRRAAFVMLAHCVAGLLLVGGPATTSAHAQTSWLPWNKQPEKPEKQPKKKDAAKDQAPAAKPKAPAEPKTAVPAGTADEQADLAFWNSVKDRGRPEELRAYLKQFPQGRFAELARLRLADAEAAQVTGSTASGAPDTNVVREIQERLYKLNYAITRFDGSVDEGTDRAIKAWQVKHEFAPSGTLNAEQLKVLRATAPATIWGAIAHPIVGTASMVFSKTSRQEAESQALAECKSKNGVACKVFAAAGSECVAVSLYRSKAPDGRGFVTHFYSRERSTATSTQRALQICNAHPLRLGNRCLMVGAACGASAATADQLNKGVPPDPVPKVKPAAKGKEEA